jgi:hypothetical protein
MRYPPPFVPQDKHALAGRESKQDLVLPPGPAEKPLGLLEKV